MRRVVTPRLRSAVSSLLDDSLVKTNSEAINVPMGTENASQRGVLRISTCAAIPTGRFLSTILRISSNITPPVSSSNVNSAIKNSRGPSSSLSSQRSSKERRSQVAR